MNLRSLKYLAAAAILAPFGAQAMDYTLSADRIVSDPLYLPLQGQIFGESSYQWATTSQDVFNSAGVKTESERINSNPFGVTFEYGITDDLAVSANIGYDPSVTTHINPVSGTGTTLTDQGWDDPTFGVVYRVLDQRDNPLTLDLGASYSPNMFSSKNASDDDDGTVARGGQEWGFNGTLGREMRDFTIAGVFDADYDGRHDALNQASGDEVGTSSSWLYTLGLATQTRFSDQFSVNAGAGYAFGHDATVVNETTLIDHDSHVKGSPNLNAALNYHFIPNVLVGSIDYQHDFGGGSQSFYAIPADDSQIQNRAEDLLGVRLRYVFQ
jgi:outer membrane protein assembly factor BamA